VEHNLFFLASTGFQNNWFPAAWEAYFNISAQHMPAGKDHALPGNGHKTFPANSFSSARRKNRSACLPKCIKQPVAFMCP
jgi:hypothetical protein